MAFDYFYGAQSQQFAFYRIPKVLFTDNRFQKISTEGKVLYGLLLDRVSLSMENGWIDDEGRVYIIFTLTTTHSKHFPLHIRQSHRKHFDRNRKTASQKRNLLAFVHQNESTIAAAYQKFLLE